MKVVLRSSPTLVLSNISVSVMEKVIDKTIDDAEMTEAGEDAALRKYLHMLNSKPAKDFLKAAGTKRLFIANQMMDVVNITF